MSTWSVGSGMHTVWLTFLIDADNFERASISRFNPFVYELNARRRRWNDDKAVFFFRGVKIDAEKDSPHSLGMTNDDVIMVYTEDEEQ